MDKVKSVVLAGLSGGSGKSVVSVALIAALRNRGKGVAAFKKGPDYIDAGWMSKAAGQPCYNLDPYLMSPEAIVSTFQRHLHGSAYAVVEGNRGIFDGVNAAGEFSTAELAQLLDLPVLLVVNCSKTTRTVAALVLGCQAFDPRIRFAGVILNQIANSRHESIIRQSMEQYTDLPVLGIMPRLKQDVFPMRHLGVTPHQEYAAAAEAVDNLAALAETHFDLDAIAAQMRGVVPLPPKVAAPAQPLVTIGVLRDAAFQFYYQENLEALQQAGARLVMIDALQSKALPPELDGLYIGGGFPETSAQQLADNASFRQSVRERIDGGLPVYAECGGLIFLGRSIILDGREFPLAGVFPVTFTLAAKPQAHGYSTFRVEKDNRFYPVGTRIKGHEFRYSRVHQWDGESDSLVLNMERGTGFAGGRDGLVKNNVLALYTHVMASGTPQWVEGFIAAARHHAGLTVAGGAEG
ncbi:hydrogenobyrinic acid a,c-diamide synthase (glutamine-hydrolysing); cobyrinate a,c-diamide synthase [Desulfobulbus propionicus DSM 2032]|uniref:Cobyrinate a,c-diamide synthase n=1 Tax=Desulfobulbus propionicus (strain ATCC 33891 / DSM 2032 / VKM B-1956 / 1pr3) TaxID=577650 RepID=A0A7U3YN30_DESPD|nr:cobyrinate a,c-diamide synthase [Desulfobulbus propionicus]ADW18407.1 hydrogenobyrinic acid a,c-diamide synthase (glutamine-hydrolysing); cobyrinate a,c-diamide synthase [Desulfobulbus propionicus DSM 2032]